MLADDLVVPYGHPNGVLVLETKYANTMTVLGSSFGQAPALKESVTNVFTFVVPKGESGIIVLRVYRYNPNTGEAIGTFSFFIGVQWLNTDEYPTANLGCQWVPKISSRIGNVLGKVLSVEVDGVVYTTGAAQKPQEVHVEDGNLICRYMNGNIDEDQFREEVGAPARERQLAEKLASEQQLVTELRGQLETCHQNSQSLSDELRERENSVAWLEYRLVQWRHAAHQVHKAVSERWWWQRRPLLAKATRAFADLNLQELQEQEAANKRRDRLR